MFSFTLAAVFCPNSNDRDLSKEAIGKFSQTYINAVVYCPNSLPSSSVELFIDRVKSCNKR